MFKRGKKLAELQTPTRNWGGWKDLIVFGEWVIGAFDKGVVVWRKESREIHTELEMGGEAGVATAICHPASFLNKVVVARRNGDLQIWNVKTGYFAPSGQVMGGKNADGAGGFTESSYTQYYHQSRPLERPRKRLPQLFRLPLSTSLRSASRPAKSISTTSSPTPLSSPSTSPLSSLPPPQNVSPHSPSVPTPSLAPARLRRTLKTTAAASSLSDTTTVS